MKYMLMMHAPKGKGEWEIFNWPVLRQMLIRGR
jgi:hypothetical protein